MALRLDPSLITRLTSNMVVVLVSGTNGKTTTTALVAAGLREAGGTITNSGGANMTGGLASSLAEATPDIAETRFAALEVDEIYLTAVAEMVAPAVFVLMNLSRDQLDRTSEVRRIAERWRLLVDEMPLTKVVANCDDPLVCYAASASESVIWVAAGISWTDDAIGCPVCGGEIVFSSGSWACSCGFCRPEPSWKLGADQTIEFPDGRIKVNPRLPGSFNLRNSLTALAACQAAGVPPSTAVTGVEAVSAVSGRFARYQIGSGTDAEVMLSLAKNPAGWSELVGMVDLIAADSALVIGLNAKIADGRDPSWIWDVPFDVFSGRSVIVTGERCLDLAVRLKYAGVDPLVVQDVYSALVVASKWSKQVVLLANYTCFQEARKALESPLAARHGGSARVVHLVGELRRWRNLSRTNGS